MLLHSQAGAQSWQDFKNQSASFAEAGKTDSAIVYANLALSITEKSFGKNSTVYADDLITLAGLYQTTNNYELAEPTLLQAVMIYKFAMGEGNKYYAAVLNKLAGLYVAMKAYEKAEPIYLQSLAILKEALGNDHPEYANTLNNVINMFTLEGDKAKTKNLLVEDLTQRENLINDQIEQVYKKAEPVFAELLAAILKKYSLDAPEYIIALNNLGLVEKHMKNYTRASFLLKEAVDICKMNLRSNAQYYIFSVFNLVKLYETMGNYASAIQLCEDGIAFQKRKSATDDINLATSLALLASLYQKSNDFGKAETLYIQALSIYEKISGSNSVDYARCLENLAFFYNLLGNYSKAFNYYQKTEEIYKYRLGTENLEYAYILTEIGKLFKLYSQYSKAEILYRESIEIRQKISGPESSDYADGLSDLGELFEIQGNHKTAEIIFIAALQIKRKLKDTLYNDYSSLLNNLASIYKITGRLADAEPLFIEIMNNTKKTLGTEHPDYAGALYGLGTLYAAAGQYEKAIPLLNDAKKILIKNTNKNFAFLSEREKEDYMHENIIGYFNYFDSFYLRCHPVVPSISTEAYNSQLVTKGIILSSGIQLRQSILESGNPWALSMFDKWNNLKKDLAHIYATPIALRGPETDSLERLADSCEKELSRVSVSFRQRKFLTQTDWKSVQQTLGPNEVAIEFSSFYYHNEKQFTDTIQYMALVLRAGDPYPAMVKLCTQAQLDSLLTSPSNTNNNFITGLYRSAVVRSASNSNINRQQLYKLIWKPFELLLHPGDHIYYSPSGLLHQIAFAAIPFNDDSLLSDRYRLTQLNSTAMLLQPAPPLDQKNMTIAAFGGIKYDASFTELALNSPKNQLAFVSRSLPDGTRGSAFNYLPGTLKEINSIDSLARVYKVHATMYSAANATEETYKGYGFTTSPDIIHIATHGFFFPDPQKADSTKSSLSIEERQEFRVSNNPLNRAGILFASANHTWKGEAVPNGSEDGILTAYEASNVTLKNTQLVVLSACETALGDIRGSEGVFGLQRAFKAAGANYLMMSLWKVPDNETAEFMKQFYKALFSGGTIEQAYTSAQSVMKNQYRKDPYKWAAFILLR